MASKYGDDAEVGGSLSVTGAFVHNEDSADVDFRVEANGQTHMLYVDSGNDRVGIGTNSPSATLEVSGTLKITGADEPALLMLDDQDGSAQIGRAHVGYVGSSDFAAFAHQDRATTTEYCVAHRSTGQTDINTSAGTNMTFRYASATRMQLDTNGYFSVGSNYAPGSHKFAVDGDALIEGDLTVAADDPRIKIDGDTDSDPGVELYENGTRKWIVYNDYTNDNLTFKTDSDVRMVIDDDGNVGIGASPSGAVVRLEVDGGSTHLNCDRYAAPALFVFNDGDNQYRYGIKIQCGTDDGTATRGIRFYDGDGGTEAGYISWSGGTVTYATFTGAHEASVVPSDYTVGQNSYDYGTVIKIVSTSTGERHKQVKYVVGPTTSAKDKAVLGVYSENMDPDELESPNDHQIFALGDGHIFVCNEGGNIEIGDFICSSDTQGHGMKQDDDLMHSYTVAKAAENVDWSSESGTTKLIACTYHAG